MSRACSLPSGSSRSGSRHRRRGHGPIGSRRRSDGSPRHRGHSPKAISRSGSTRRKRVAGLVGARRARRPVQRHGRSPRGERRDHPARPRPQPRLPRRRVARAADPDRRPADLQRAPDRPGRRRSRRPVRSSSRPAGSSSSDSTGSPRTCSSCPSSIPASSCLISGRTTCGRPSNRPSSRHGRPRIDGASTLSLSLPTAPLRVRHDPQRIGQVADEPDRQRDQVHAARRSGRSSRRCRRARVPGSSHRYRRRDRCRASCRGSSIASTAARERTRRGAVAAGSAWRSCARSSTCTAARSRSSSRLGAGSSSRSCSRGIRGSMTSRRRPTSRGTPTGGRPEGGGFFTDRAAGTEPRAVRLGLAPIARRTVPAARCTKMLPP